MSVCEDVTELLASKYDGRAEVYRACWAPVLEEAGLRLLKALVRGRVRSVLDVGTGVGTMLPHLQEAFPLAKVMGVDRSPGMLALAPERFRGEVMDARDLAVPSESMDLVTMHFMLFHLPDPCDGLREARRVLRPSGRLGTITWASEPFESDAHEVWADCLDAYGAADPEPQIPSSRGDLDTPQKMKAVLRESGFSSVAAWEEELIATIEREDLLRLNSKMGPTLGRYESLSPEAQRACIAEARERMKRLPASAFVSRGRVVYSVATR